jgi:CheY-like chemotaxis protein
MVNTKKYSIVLDNVPDSERIILKLICSVSARTKGRDKHYELFPRNHPGNTDLVIRGNECKDLNGDIRSAAYIVEMNGVDFKENEKNNQTLSKPLIATRVLAALDNFVEGSNLKKDDNKADDSFNEDGVLESAFAYEAEVPDEVETLSFEISEEEASDLAIVHDESLSNPANKDDENLRETASAQITQIRFGREKNTELIKEDINTEEISALSDESAVTPRALVVDDSPSVRKQLELELELFEVDVDYAATAKEAMEYLGQVDYDVAFLDVVLPDKDGFSICRHIKETSEGTSVIMLTGKAKQADKVKGALAGCDAYMVKPVGRLTFQTTVRNYLTLMNSSSVVEA